MIVLTEINKLLTEKFCTALNSALSTLEVTKPWSIPYHEERHGMNLEAFQQYPDKFTLFQNKYYELVDQLLFLATHLGLSEAGLQRLDEQLISFKEHLFDPGYCDARPNILWNSAREHLEVLVVLLQKPEISAEKRLDVINNIGFNLLFCSDGVVSYLQDSIQMLVSDSVFIPRAKEILVQQLLIEFVQDNHLCSLDMEVHYVNAFFNYFSDNLGLNQRPYEQTVATDNYLVEQLAAACWQTLTEKLPSALVSYLSDELCSAGYQALQDGQLEGEPWQHFLESPLVKFFTASGIIQALFVQDEQSGGYVFRTDSRSLHWLVARHLMEQGWLQPQEPRHLMDQNEGALYTLADYWFCWQSQEDSNDQRPLTAEEFFKLFVHETQSQPDQAAPLPRLIRLLELAAEWGSAEAQVKLGLMYVNAQRVDKNIQKAFRYFQLAADQGDAQAQFNLGLMYTNVYKNEEDALRYFQLAADQGVAEFQFNLALMYANGKGVDKNEQEAFRYYKLAADSGHADAQCTLGAVYLEGRGVDKNEQEASRYWNLAADQGHVYAQSNRWMMDLTILLAYQNRRDEFQFTKFYAEQGDAQAQFNLGLMYANGKGVDKNEQEAFRYFRLAADNGHSQAQRILGERVQQVQEIYHDEQPTASSDQAATDLNSAQNQPVTEEILLERITLPDPTGLAEAVASFDENEPAIHGVAAADNVSFFNPLLSNLSHLDKAVED